MNFSGFFFALFGDWVGMMSGAASVVLTITGLVSRAKNWKQSFWTEAWLFWTAGLICFFLASAHVWTIEHDKVDQLNSDLAKLDMPMLQGVIHLKGVAPAGVGNKDTLLVVVADIENTGAPSIAKDIKVGLRIEGVMHWGREINPTQQTITDTAKGDTLMFMKSDWLPLKAQQQPIPRGGSVQGFVQVLVENISRDKVRSSSKPKVIVAFDDIYGHHHETQADLGESQKLLTPEHLQPELER